ncbi:MAG: uracil-DNA glycosylase family protein [Acidimicrobiia bacterium]|nr:MAG: uracil-DNA glycosylase family protein [Acidimicrobiia bacterium]
MEQRSELFGGRSSASLDDLSKLIVACRECPRLVAWREEVATVKRAAYANEEYWGRPVPGFGDPDASIAVVGLAPAAHGANRTGRMFTGDRSGDWLYRAMYRAGLASQPTSTSIDDGLELRGAWVTAPVRCAPPQNKPNPDESANCAPWLDAEMRLLSGVSVFVVLGQIGYHALWAHLGRTGEDLPRPRPKFGHGQRVSLGNRTILMSYHVSQQNTFTGRLTERMLDDVFASAVQTARAANEGAEERPREGGYGSRNLPDTGTGSLSRPPA